MSVPPAPLATSETAPASLPVTHRPEKIVYNLRHRHRPWVMHQKLIGMSFVGDLCVVILGLVLAYVIRFESHLREFGVFHPGMDLWSYLGHVVAGCVFMMVLLVNYRVHDPRNFLAIRRTLAGIFKACVVWFVAFLTLALVLKIEPPISRVYCAIACVLTMLSLMGWRWFFYCVLRRDSFAAALRQRALFVGWNGECDRAVKRFMEGRSRQIAVTGVIVPPRGFPEGAPPPEVQVLGPYGSLRSIIRDSGADMVMAVDGSLGRQQMLELAEICGKEFVDFKLVPSCFQVMVSSLHLESFHGMPVLGVGKLPLHHVFNNALKRALDIIGSLFGLLVSAPVMAVFGVLVYLESRGPVIYRQRRIGLNGKPFDIFKIRSMKPDAESGNRPGWTIKNDPRCLRVGRLMREWNIDELPQFWNVLCGDMSLVGPRPERPELIEGFKEEIPHYNVRHSIKPGVTGWAQVNGLRGDTCLRERIKFDLDYIEHWNFLFDLQILVMTVFTRKGAC